MWSWFINLEATEASWTIGRHCWFMQALGLGISFNFSTVFVKQKDNWAKMEMIQSHLMCCFMRHFMCIAKYEKLYSLNDDIVSIIHCLFRYKFKKITKNLWCWIPLLFVSQNLLLHIVWLTSLKQIIPLTRFAKAWANWHQWKTWTF